MEHEVQERLVERRQPEEGNDPKHQRAGCESARCSSNFSGRRSRAPIRSENETSGAQAGAVSAMVRPSLTPITMPATSGPSGLPRPPIITTANTTPTQA